MTAEETRAEFNRQLLQLASAMLAGLSANRHWDEVSDWSRMVRASDEVTVRISPGDHATSLAVTFAHKGVTELAPAEFDAPDRPDPADRPPSESRDAFEKRAARFLDAVDRFNDWHRAGELVKSVAFRGGLTVSRIVPREGGVLVTLTKKEPAPAPPGADAGG